MKKRKVSHFLKDERGSGVVEVILVMVIVIGLIIIFKSQIEALVTQAFQSIMGDASRIFK